MAYLVVDKDGTELLFVNEPIKADNTWFDDSRDNSHTQTHWSSLKNGTIKQLTGKELTWEDEFIKI